jgi:hypothetical protein
MKPEPKRTASCSITPKFEMRSSVSMPLRIRR